MISPRSGNNPASSKDRGISAAAARIWASSIRRLSGSTIAFSLLFEKSSEFKETKGLGLIPGQVIQIDSKGLKIPHMGWNDLQVLNPCVMTEDMEEDPYVYFVHYFRAETEDENISCYTVYGERIPALVHRGMVYGAQFHPEKSGKTGLKMLENFARLVRV